MPPAWPMASLALDILQEFAGLNGFFETGGMAGKAGFLADKGTEKIGRGWTVRFLAGIAFPPGLKEVL